jgi:cell division inhibitor SepF
MPGAMRKMGVYLGLVEDDDWGEAYSDAPALERSSGHRDDYAEARYSREHAHAGHSQARHAEVAHAGRGRDGRDYRDSRDPRDHREYADDADGYGPPALSDDAFPSYQITTLHPRTYNEARTIGEHFRKNTPVIMNLSEMEDADAKRLVDFAAGLSFGLHGRIERVTAKVFLLSPHNVTVTAADKARIAETGFFNQS